MVARLIQYAKLMRWHKPIGIFLLLWPTLWALWLASGGWPDHWILFVFVMGTILMRSAGCVVSDIFDRHYDAHVERTRERPIASGQVSVVEAVVLAGVLSLVAFLLVLTCNRLTVELAVLGGLFVVIYPLLKRVTHLPQLGLGVAFSWGVPMAFAAVTGHVSQNAKFLFEICLVWPVIYDTMYAMVDRDDDIGIGVKSTAILFGRSDRLMIGLLQGVFTAAMVGIGVIFTLSPIYYMGLAAAAGLFLYQQWLISGRERSRCFRAFLNNNWVGFLIFVGIYFQ